VLYATDRAAYGRLARIITEGRLRKKKGDCAITLDDVAKWSQGLIGAVIATERRSDEETEGIRTATARAGRPRNVKRSRQKSTSPLCRFGRFVTSSFFCSIDNRQSTPFVLQIPIST
jgi:DNA polymerase III alpha subunit